MFFIGIDPGKTGAFAIIDSESNIIHLADFESPQQIVQKLNLFRDDTQAVIEDVNSFGMGRQSAFVFGHNCGMWEGVLISIGIPYRHVRPQKWQKGIIRKTDGKEANLSTARRMFPGADLRLKKHHNRADALLIADWLRRSFTV